MPCDDEFFFFGFEFLRFFFFDLSMTLPKKKEKKSHLFEVGRVPGLVHGPDAVQLVHGLVDERDLRCLFWRRS